MHIKIVTQKASNVSSKLEQGLTFDIRYGRIKKRRLLAKIEE